MRHFTIVLSVGVWVLLATLRSAAVITHQTPAPDPAARALQLVSTTVSGREPAVPCEQLDADTAKALIAFGTGARSESFERIARAFRLAERAGRCLNSDPLLGSALLELSGTVKDWGHFDEALAAAEEAVRVFERTDDRSQLARAWTAVGNAQGWLNNNEAMFAAWDRALEIARAAHDRSVEARVLNNIAAAHTGNGELTKAIDELTTAMHAFEELGDWQRAAVVVNNIAINYLNRGEYTTALEYNTRGLELNRTVGSTARLAVSLDTRANIFRARGAYSQALDAFEQSLAIRQTIGDNVGLMETTHNIGLVHYSQGDYDLALAAYKRALGLNRTLHDNAFEAEALRNIGAAALRLGQRRRATANFRQSLIVARKENRRVIEGELLNDLGDVARLDGSLAAAARWFQSALELRQEIHDEAGVTGSLTSLASIRLEQAHFDEASRLAQQAVVNAQAHDQPELLWSAETVLGTAYARLRRPAARDTLRTAIASVEALSRQVVGGDTFRQRFFEEKLSPYHELIDLDVREHRVNAAFELAERSKARVLSRVVGRSGVPDDEALRDDEKRERTRLAEDLFAINQRIGHEQEKAVADSSRMRALEDERRAARERMAAFETLLAAQHPEFARARGEIATVSAADLASLLPDPRTVVVEYVVGERQVFAFVIAARGGRVVIDARTIPIAADILERRCAEFRDRISARDFAFRGDGSALYQLLIQPFARELAGASQLVVVPDGPLWNVPFQALISDRGYLIEQLPVSYVPSLTVLREIDRLPKRTGPLTLFAMGRSHFDEPPHQLEDLPEAELQVRQVSAIYGAARSATYIGRNATEHQFKASAARYSVLHIATHGILDEASPLYSYLALVPDVASAEDGHLEAWEIMRLKLSADLVVLSACDTGRGRIAPGEGVIGTMWAFAAAGARSIVVSQYRAEAKSATDELVSFHRRVAAGAGSRSTQLREAALALLRTPRFAHPYYWAAFILVGDSR